MVVRFLKHPLAGILAIIGGIFWGVYFPENARRLGNLSDAYLLLIQMTIIPILVSAIISSVGQFVQNPNFTRIASKIWKVVVLALLFVVVLSLGFGILFKPGTLSQEGSDYLSRYIGSQTDVLILNLDENNRASTDQQGFFSVFVSTLIPANLFGALAGDKTLSLAFVSVIIGIAAGFYQLHLRKKGKRVISLLIAFCDNVFATFQVIISAVLVLLPIALVFIISNLIAVNGIGIFASTIRLIITFYSIGILLLLLGSMILSIATRQNFFRILRVSLGPAFLGFMTRNSVATIPSCIEKLHKDLNMNENLSKLLVPLFLVLCRYGNLAYFAVVTIFSMQIYQIDFGFVEFVILILSLIFASVATAGASGFATLNVISIAFLPLGVPVETMLVILYAIDPIIDPIRTMLIVHTNFSAIGIIGSSPRVQASVQVSAQTANQQATAPRREDHMSRQPHRPSSGPSGPSARLEQQH